MLPSRHACLLGASLLALSALPAAGAATAGCGTCNYTLEFVLHATVVDAATGEPIATPTFLDGSNTPIGAHVGTSSTYCEAPTDAAGGACETWRVSMEEGAGAAAVQVGAPGYATQVQDVPAGGHRCATDGDEVTKTFRLVKSP